MVVKFAANVRLQRARTHKYGGPDYGVVTVPAFKDEPGPGLAPDDNRPVHVVRQDAEGRPLQYQTIRSTVGGVPPSSRNRVAFWPR